MRRIFLQTVFLIVVLEISVGYFWHPFLFGLIFLGPLILLGLLDAFQTHHTIRRNFPIIGHGRYLMEMIRPEINQYFVESNSDGRPFSREERSVVYQRAKRQGDTLPFG